MSKQERGDDTGNGAERASRPPVIVDVGIDVNDLDSMRAFWTATLGYFEVRGTEAYSYLQDPSGRGPHVFLQVVPERRTEKNRLHLDIVVPSLPEAAERAIERGAAKVDERRTPITWFYVMEDPEGNQFCLVDEGYWEQTRPPYWKIRTED